MAEPMRSSMIKLSAITEKLGHNPRKDYGQHDGSLEEFVASIRERGVLSPVLVRAADPLRMSWYVVAGHRRVMAARQAGLTEIPALCLEYQPRGAAADLDNLALALIENLQRRELNHMELAHAYAKMSASGVSQLEIARLVGKGQAHVCLTLQLLDLPTHVQEAIRAGELSMMQGLELRKMVKAGKSEAATNKMAQLVAKERLSAPKIRAAILADTSRRDAAPKVQASSLPKVQTSDLAQRRELATWATQKYGSVTRALERLREIEGQS